MPFHVSVVIYNSAGEAVKHLFDGASQDQPGGFTLSSQFVVPGSLGVQLQFGGLLSTGQSFLGWQGLNDMGQDVAGGVYTIKVQQKDSFGNVESWDKEVSVLPPANQQWLAVYNSAGELVTRIDISSLGVTGELTDVGFSNPAQTGFVLPGGSSNGTGVSLALKEANGSVLAYTWDGRNSQGQEVASGTYVVQLMSQGTGSSQILSSKTFTVLSPIKPGAPKVLTGPNPLGPKDTSLVFKFAPQPVGDAVTVKLYNVAGELVAQGLGNASRGKLNLAVGNWASGIYLAVFEVWDHGSLLSKQLIKVAIQR
jgi:hypothetical protein